MRRWRRQSLQRPYQVSVQSIKLHDFVVDANSPEEAESIVEDFLEDGEEGTPSSIEHEIQEVVPVDDAGMGELVAEDA